MAMGFIVQTIRKKAMNKKTRLWLAHKLSWLWQRIGDIEDRVLKPLTINRHIMPLDELEELIRVFPPGYDRSELRIVWKKREKEEK